MINNLLSTYFVDTKYINQADSNKNFMQERKINLKVLF